MSRCFDEYHEDWSQLKQVIAHGEAYVVDAGFEFARDRALLYEKFPQYESEAPIEEDRLWSSKCGSTVGELGFRRLERIVRRACQGPGRCPGRRDTDRSPRRPALARARRSRAARSAGCGSRLADLRCLPLAPAAAVAAALVGHRVPAAGEDGPAGSDRRDRRSAAGFDEVVSTQLELATASQIGTGLVGLIGIIYAASGFVARVRHALGAVFRSRKTGLVVGRVSGALIGVPVVVLLVAFASAAAWVTGLRLEGVLGVTVEFAAFLALAAFGAGTWALVYRLLTPSPGPTLREHLPGAAAFTVGFLVLERFGAVYVAGVVTQHGALRCDRCGFRAAGVHLRGDVAVPARGRGLDPPAPRRAGRHEWWCMKSSISSTCRICSSTSFAWCPPGYRCTSTSRPEPAGRA